MYLSRGTLNPASRDVQRDLADPAQLHRTIMRLFSNGVGDSARQALGVLHRVDMDPRQGGPVLFVQSAERPEFSHLPRGYFLDPESDLDLALASDGQNPAVRPVESERAAISERDRFVFRLRANTTKRIMTKSLPDGTKQNGKRVPVRGDQARLQWLQRRAELGGFRVEDVRSSEILPVRSRGKDRGMTFAGALFEGTLVVTAAEAFRAALANGIGAAKAFGFGLLSIKRVRG